jgi:elongation factor Tu
MGIFDFLKPKNIMVDQNNVQPVQPVQTVPINSNGAFEFVIEDIFMITGRGTVVTGRVLKGVVKVGDEVTISPSGIRTVVTGIEQFRKTLDYAQEGDNAGILLRGVSREQIQKGNMLIK